MTMSRAVTVLLLGALALPATAAPRSAPAVELRFGDGRTVPLSSYRGKVLLIDFFASWCGPCKASFPALDGLYRELRDQGLEVVAIDVDEDAAAGRAFLAERPHQMPVVPDPKGALPAAFGVGAMPSSFVIDKKGVIRFRHEGYNDRTLAAYRTEIESLLDE